MSVQTKEKDHIPLKPAHFSSRGDEYEWGRDQREGEGTFSLRGYGSRDKQPNPEKEENSWRHRGIGKVETG